MRVLWWIIGIAIVLIARQLWRAHARIRLRRYVQRLVEDASELARASAPKPHGRTDQLLALIAKLAPERSHALRTELAEVRGEASLDGHDRQLAYERESFKPTPRDLRRAAREADRFLDEQRRYLADDTRIDVVVNAVRVQLETFQAAEHPPGNAAARDALRVRFDEIARDAGRCRREANAGALSTVRVHADGLERDIAPLIDTYQTREAALLADLEAFAAHVGVLRADGVETSPFARESWAPFPVALDEARSAVEAKRLADAERVLKSARSKLTAFDREWRTRLQTDQRLHEAETLLKRTDESDLDPLNLRDTYNEARQRVSTARGLVDSGALADAKQEALRLAPLMEAMQATRRDVTDKIDEMLKTLEASHERLAALVAEVGDDLKPAVGEGAGTAMRFSPLPDVASLRQRFEVIGRAFTSETPDVPLPLVSMRDRLTALLRETERAVEVWNVWREHVEPLSDAQRLVDRYIPAAEDGTLRDALDAVARARRMLQQRILSVAPLTLFNADRAPQAATDADPNAATRADDPAMLAAREARTSLVATCDRMRLRATERLHGLVRRVEALTAPLPVLASEAAITPAADAQPARQSERRRLDTEQATLERFGAAVRTALERGDFAGAAKLLQEGEDWRTHRSDVRRLRALIEEMILPLETDLGAALLLDEPRLQGVPEDLTRVLFEDGRKPYRHWSQQLAHAREDAERRISLDATVAGDSRSFETAELAAVSADEAAAAARAHIDRVGTSGDAAIPTLGGSVQRADGTVSTPDAEPIIVPDDEIQEFVEARDLSLPEHVLYLSSVYRRAMRVLVLRRLRELDAAIRAFEATGASRDGNTAYERLIRARKPLRETGSALMQDASTIDLEPLPTRWRDSQKALEDAVQTFRDWEARRARTHKQIERAEARIGTLINNPLVGEGEPARLLADARDTIELARQHLASGYAPAVEAALESIRGHFDRLRELVSEAAIDQRTLHRAALESAAPYLTIDLREELEPRFVVLEDRLGPLWTHDDQAKLNAWAEQLETALGVAVIDLEGNPLTEKPVRAIAQHAIEAVLQLWLMRRDLKGAVYDGAQDSRSRGPADWRLEIGCDPIRLYVELLSSANRAVNPDRLTQAILRVQDDISGTPDVAPALSPAAVKRRVSALVRALDEEGSAEYADPLLRRCAAEAAKVARPPLVDIALGVGTLTDRRRADLIAFFNAIAEFARVTTLLLRFCEDEPGLPPIWIKRLTRIRARHATLYERMCEQPPTDSAPLAAELTHLMDRWISGVATVGEIVRVELFDTEGNPTRTYRIGESCVLAARIGLRSLMVGGEPRVRLRSPDGDVIELPLDPNEAVELAALKVELDSDRFRIGRWNVELVADGRTLRRVDMDLFTREMMPDVPIMGSVDFEFTPEFLEWMQQQRGQPPQRV